MITLLAYLIVIGVSAVAYLNINFSWLALVLGTTLLASIQLIERRRFRPRLVELGRVDLLHTTSMTSVANSFVAALAACLLGIGTRLVFG